ncbi:alpha/beta hydrolase fold-domain-containing protein [Sparassis latifolia]
MPVRNMSNSLHHECMPFARQPLKAIYVSQRLLTTLLLVPVWVFHYALLPRKFRPRTSWSLRQIVTVNFYRRIFKVTELAGVEWGTREPDEACDNSTLTETRFEWIDPLPECLRSGIVVDKQVPFKKVGAFVWPKGSPSEDRHGSKAALASESNVEANGDDEPVIGIFLHGGGYCHMSAHEHAGTSRIPRRLMEDKTFSSIYSVEYRLLQHAPFPAAVQDAAAVYAHIVHQHKGTSNYVSNPNGSETPVTPKKERSVSHPEMPQVTDILTVNYTTEIAKNEKENNEVKARVEAAARETHCKIVLIGDSSGGNLVLALARWIRDEGFLPPPAGLILLSPSCDPSHAFPETPSSYVPRPHADTDYLVDTPEPRALLQRTFLGHNPLETMHSPYVSPVSRRVLRAFYGDAFVASVEDLTIGRLDTGLRETLRTMASEPATLADELEPSPTLARPVIASPRGLSLFSEFPRVCVVLGDAERLEREVMKLVGAMERDGVDLCTVWVEDGVHDVLQLTWWDERVRDKVWASVEEWAREVR